MRAPAYPDGAGGVGASWRPGRRRGGEGDGLPVAAAGLVDRRSWSGGRRKPAGVVWAYLENMAGIRAVACWAGAPPGGGRQPGSAARLRIGGRSPGWPELYGMRGRLFGRSAGAGISFPGMGILGGFPLVVTLFGGFEGRIW